MICANLIYYNGVLDPELMGYFRVLTVLGVDRG